MHITGIQFKLVVLGFMWIFKNTDRNMCEISDTNIYIWNIEK